MRMAIAVVMVVSVALMPGGIRADVKLPKILGDYMVLQQGIPAPIWGNLELSKALACSPAITAKAIAPVDTSGSTSAITFVIRSTAAALYFAHLLAAMLRAVAVVIGGAPPGSGAKIRPRESLGVISSISALYPT